MNKYLTIFVFVISGNAFAETSHDRCEFSKGDPKGNLFLIKEYDEWSLRGGPGPLVETYKMSPIVSKDPKTGLTVGNFKDGDLQSSEILKIIVPYGCNNQLAMSEEGVADLRDQVKARTGLAEDLDELPCDPSSIRICATAEPFTYIASEADEKKYSEAQLKKQYRRITTLRIEHCLSNEKLPPEDEKKIHEACDEPPNGTPLENRGYPQIRRQIVDCAKAIKEYLAKAKNHPLNENGKYIPNH